MSEPGCEGRTLNGSWGLVVASGELDMLTSEGLRLAFREAGADKCTHLLVDLSDVTFMDSSAISVLASVQRGALEPLHVVATNRAVLMVLHITGLDKVVQIHGTRAEVLSASGTVH